MLTCRVLSWFQGTLLNLEGRVELWESKLAESRPRVSALPPQAILYKALHMDAIMPISLWSTDPVPKSLVLDYWVSSKHIVENTAVPNGSKWCRTFAPDVQNTFKVDVIVRCKSIELSTYYTIAWMHDGSRMWAKWSTKHVGGESEYLRARVRQRITWHWLEPLKIYVARPYFDYSAYVTQSTTDYTILSMLKSILIETMWCVLIVCGL